jgi:hypothetical protein
VDQKLDKTENQPVKEKPKEYQAIDQKGLKELYKNNKVFTQANKFFQIKTK